MFTAIMVTAIIVTIMAITTMTVMTITLPPGGTRMDRNRQNWPALAAGTAACPQS